MLVFIDLPPQFTAEMLAPLPRWQTMIFHLIIRFSNDLSGSLRYVAVGVPWKP